jgi:1-deoxy-D-xylulose-5-phosphate synthase
MSALLDSINSPSDLKKIPVEGLPQLAQEIRERLIAVTSKNGGHLGPNLGVVELTIALHYVFNTPQDSILFDVSHQAYVHKLLTGRREQFDTIRQPAGLNGFMLRTESPHDSYGAGHAGTALSAALGMAVARDLRNEQGRPDKSHVIAVAGDAAFTCGISYEALNNIGSTKRLIIVLNDNEWSIDKNVGAIADYFNKIVTNRRYQVLHDTARQWAKALGGSTALEIGRRIEESAKGLIVPSVIFEEFGLNYYGPTDGHDLPTLIRMFEFLKTQERPVILHALTKKGKGFDPATQSQKKFHGLGPYNPQTGETKPAAVPTYSEIFAETLVKLADRDPRVVGITAAMPNGTALDKFQPKHPKRYFDVGIAEEHAVLFAAGMATKGFKPFCAIYSTFLQRAFDPVVHDVALQQLPVVFCMDRGGLSGDDGPTHHGLFDISYLRGIPNLVHMDPKNEDELADMMLTALQYDGPSAIRYPRGAVTGSGVKPQPQPIPIGDAEIVHDGEQVAIFSLGNMLPLALETARQLEQEGFTAAVINARFAKPLDRRTLLNYARLAGLVITFEDHVLSGGFGSAVLEELNSADVNVPVVRIGWPDQFIEHGNPEALRKKYGVSVEAALEKSRPHLSRMAKKTIAAAESGEPAHLRFSGF